MSKALHAELQKARRRQDDPIVFPVPELFQAGIYIPPQQPAFRRPVPVTL